MNVLVHSALSIYTPGRGHVFGFENAFMHLFFLLYFYILKKGKTHLICRVEASVLLYRRASELDFAIKQ